MYDIFKEVASKFRLPGEVYSYDAIVMGNINMTYKVTFERENGTYKSYLFQRVNTKVFKNPAQIMENIDRVTNYIREKYPNQTTLHFHHTDDGLNYYVNDDKSFWRVVNFVDSITFNTSDDLRVIELTGKAFGQFQTQLSDFDGSLLYETIPDFHNTRKRLDTLFLHVAEDPCSRVKKVKNEVDYISSVRDKASLLSVMFENGEIPKRVTHNDTKCNNVLFDRVTKDPIVVIDLDTIMPGMSLYDFADAVRFIANTSVEDEPDISKVSFDTKKFEAFTKGFISETYESLEPVELNNLVKATFAITVELACRFLDDYITGDQYFRCAYAKHNLIRARCQLQLAKDIERKSEELEKIVQSVIKAQYDK
jgi:Ser/Thr protein kinase RdoA (MazF antagonist)